MNFNYFVDDDVVDFILEAVEIVASDGWKLLPQYRFTPDTGLWRHAAGAAEPPLSLTDISYADGHMEYAAHRHREPASRLADYLVEARSMLASRSANGWKAEDPADLDPEFELLRWFPLPTEVAASQQ